MYSQIVVYGEYEPAESHFIRHVLSEGDFAVDIGANHGWFSVEMANCVSALGVVWAVEPIPESAVALEKNLALNPNLKVRLLRVALGAEEGMQEMFLFEGQPHGHASAATFGRHDLIRHQVEVRTLDSVLSERDGSSPLLVKLDVEGAERDVLRGATETLSGNRPPIWMIEVNYQTARAFGYEPNWIHQTVTSADGYRAYRIASSRLRREVAPESAPHGTTWVFVPECHVSRVETLEVAE